MVRLRHGSLLGAVARPPARAHHRVNERVRTRASGYAGPTVRFAAEILASPMSPMGRTRLPTLQADGQVCDFELPTARRVST